MPSLLSCVLEIFIIESLIEEEERSSGCVKAVEGERVEATIFRHQAATDSSKRSLRRAVGDGEEADLEMLNVQKGRGQRPPRAEDRMLAVKRQREKVHLRKDFCFRWERVKHN